MKDWLIALVQAVGLVALVIVSVGALVRFAYGQSGCNVNELYVVAYGRYNPTERHQQMLRWLHTTGPTCSTQDLVVIWNHLAEWAGSADSAELRYKVTALYEKAVTKK